VPESGPGPGGTDGEADDLPRITHREPRGAGADQEQPFDDAELDSAIAALSEPGRLREAELIVNKAAPQLQRVLAAALQEGGWFDEAHRSEALKAATTPDPDERIAAVRALLAEETRIGMMVGVAVGWQLAHELSQRPDPRDRHDRDRDHQGD
jgi:hypothetical protein